MSEEKKSSILGDTYIKTKNDTLVIRAGLKLFICWIIFVILTLAYVYFFFVRDTEEFPGRDNTVELDIPENASYAKCEIDEINTLIEDYLNATVSCNQEKLQSLVTDSSKFDDMTTLENISVYLRGYNNITCYIADGYQEGEYIIIELSNMVIANVESQPLDIQSFYVITDSDGSYKINNGDLSEETENYITSFKGTDEIQDIYIHVKENIEYLIETDEVFNGFYSLIEGE